MTVTLVCPMMGRVWFWGQSADNIEVVGSVGVTVLGEAGDDTLMGGDGNDTIDGGLVVMTSQDGGSG